MSAKAALLAALLLLAAAGCAKWQADKAPAGFAIVREHVIMAPGNDPPISSKLDFTLTAIDGAAITRETVPPWVDIQPGALVAAGRHSFKAWIAPHFHRPGDIRK